MYISVAQHYGIIETKDVQVHVQQNRKKPAQAPHYMYQKWQSDCGRAVGKVQVTTIPLESRWRGKCTHIF